MKYRPRIYYTETDKALMWDRWQKGESLHSIASHFGRSHGSIAGIATMAMKANISNFIFISIL